MEGHQQSTSDGDDSDDSVAANNTLELPSFDAFRNLKTAKRFAIDIGGSLAKVAYYSTIEVKEPAEEPSSSTKVCLHSMTQNIKIRTGKSQIRGRLHFVKFELKYIESCLDFIERNVRESGELLNMGTFVSSTGAGVYKYRDLITSKLAVQVNKADEIECLTKGCVFVLRHIPDEAFIYDHSSFPQYRFQGVDQMKFPFLLVNIGSGVSFIKIESESSYARIGGTANGGGTFWGLGSLLTHAKSFDELLSLAAKGDHRNVDMLVGDITGLAASYIGLHKELIASSFGKAARLTTEGLSVLLFALHHVRSNDVITNQLEIHCKATRFPLLRPNGDRNNVRNNVRWEKKEGDSWNHIATVTPNAPDIIAQEWRERVRVRFTKKYTSTDDSDTQFYTVDSFLTIDNVKKDDGGQYRCRYREIGRGNPLVSPKFSVTILDAEFNQSSREIAIQEGENLVIIPSLRAVAISRKWKRPWDDEPQYGNELRVNRIRRDQNGTYTFSYTVAERNDVVYSEFFYVPVNARPTTQDTTTSTGSTTNITLPGPSKTTVPTTNLPVPTTSIAHVTLPPLTTATKISSSTSSPNSPIIASTSSKNENTSPRSSIEILPPLTTPNISTFMSTRDLNDSVTPALQTGEVKDIETPTLVGIIVGAVLGTVLLIMILILILGRTGKLPNSCRKLRKDTTQGRSDNQNVPINVNDVYDNIQNQYDDLNDPYTDLTLPANSDARPAHTTFLRSTGVQPVRNDYLTVTETVRADHQSESVHTDYVTPTEPQPTDTYCWDTTEPQPILNESDRTDYLTVTETQPIGIVYPTPIQGEPDSADYMTMAEAQPIRTDYLTPLEMDPIHTESVEYVNYIPIME